MPRNFCCQVKSILKIMPTREILIELPSRQFPQSTAELTVALFNLWQRIESVCGWDIGYMQDRRHECTSRWFTARTIFDPNYSGIGKGSFARAYACREPMGAPRERYPTCNARIGEDERLIVFIQHVTDFGVAIENLSVERLAIWLGKQWPPKTQVERVVIHVDELVKKTITKTWSR